MSTNVLKNALRIKGSLSGFSDLVINIDAWTFIMLILG